jgi:LuxR family maltose regulon positive regulatory protein
MSASVILQTKLTPPPVRADCVHRPRLAERFKASAEQRLTLVCAPAGYGKSTLLSEWFVSETAIQMSFGWLSLDEDDNDPVRFLIYLVSAFANASGMDVEEILAVLHSSQPPPPKIILTTLIGNIAAA